MTDTVLTIPALVVLLGTLVFFHELGHFAVAKLLKIRVEEFAFGFGPKWIRLFKRGDTEYTIHPIPLGGFVKLAGGEFGEEEVPGGFLSKPWYSRFIVYFAGPFMSFVLAYLIFSVLGFAFGIPTGIENRVQQVVKQSVAEKAGLKAGDFIVEIDGKRITTGEQMVKIIHANPDKPLRIIVRRDGADFTLHATPQAKEVDGKKIGLIGFTPAAKIEKVGPLESIKYGTLETTMFLKLIIQSVFSREVAKNVGGPIAIAAATKMGVESGFPTFLRLMGLLSLSLGIVNLLPIPVVDGGQMMMLVVEGLNRRRLSRRTWEIAQRVGLAMIATLFVLIMYLDLSKLVAGRLLQ